MLCKFGWNWPKGFWEKVKHVNNFKTTTTTTTTPMTSVDSEQILFRKALLNIRFRLVYIVMKKWFCKSYLKMVKFDNLWIMVNIVSFSYRKSIKKAIITFALWIVEIKSVFFLLIRTFCYHLNNHMVYITLHLTYFFLFIQRNVNYRLHICTLFCKVKFKKSHSNVSLFSWS